MSYPVLATYVRDPESMHSLIDQLIDQARYRGKDLYAGLSIISPYLPKDLDAFSYLMEIMPPSRDPISFSNFNNVHLPRLRSDYERRIVNNDTIVRLSKN